MLEVRKKLGQMLAVFIEAMSGDVTVEGYQGFPCTGAVIRINFLSNVLSEGIPLYSNVAN